MQAILVKSDVSKSGDLDLKEFTDYIMQHERELHFVFETLDENKDGERVPLKTLFAALEFVLFDPAFSRTTKQRLLSEELLFCS